ncbi:hypothetical protein B0H12DRAFT_1068722 [Mycena haematopus]|nr:hypothetical protein B0H12DRAFT_1068722 [Mycena haematopus]
MQTTIAGRRTHPSILRNGVFNAGVDQIDTFQKTDSSNTGLQDVPSLPLPGRYTIAGHASAALHVAYQCQARNERERSSVLWYCAAATTPRPGPFWLLSNATAAHPCASLLLLGGLKLVTACVCAEESMGEDRHMVLPAVKPWRRWGGCYINNLGTLCVSIIFSGAGRDSHALCGARTRTGAAATTTQQHQPPAHTQSAPAELDGAATSSAEDLQMLTGFYSLHDRA